jgi:hypothetical protein
MAVALPIAAFVLAAWFFRADPRGRALSRGSLRKSLLLAAVSCALWVALGTELLGAARAVRFGPLVAWWGAPVLLLSARIAVAVRSLPAIGKPRLNPGEWLLAAATAGIVAAAGTVAVLAPSNNWDAMAYHMPRQIYWMQQHDVEHHLTYEWRQIEMPPFSEFAGLHLMILSGGDRFSNLIQWSALVLTLAAVSLIARELGAGRKGQLLAAFWAASVPMAYHQASSAKNDLVVALWSCVLALQALEVRRDRTCGAARAAGIGAVAGLLLLTKGTGAIYAAPSLAVAGISLLGRRGLLALSTLVPLVALSLNAGHLSRNFRYFGSVLGTDKGGYSNETHAPAPLAMNVLRNTLLNLGTPSDRVNQFVVRRARDLGRVVGAPIDDPRTNFMAAPFDIRYLPEQDDVAGAPVHAVLAVALAAALLLPRSILPVAFGAYAAIPYGAFLLFSAVLRWQPWHARLELPAFCLLAPLLGTACAALPRVAAGAALAAVLVLAPSLRGGLRPLVGAGNVFVSDRLTLTFRGRGELRDSSVEVARFVASVGPATVALDPVRDSWEYPLQSLIRRAAPAAPRFAAARGYCFTRPKLKPDRYDLAVLYDSAVLELRADNGAQYRLVRQFPPYSVYLRDDLAGRFADGPTAMAFVGWEESEGLWGVEGPYLDRGLPQGRWGLGPRTRLGFTAAGGPTRLEVTAWGNNEHSLTMRVRVNGLERGQIEFAPGYRRHEAGFDFEARSGSNEIVLEYSDWDRRFDRPIAVFFSRVALLPLAGARR